MSSLRVETLRLCWLEAFIAVEEEESISGAARQLGVDQSTVSRYMQALEKWLGKGLLEHGGASDPEDARVYIGITQEGRDFRVIAVNVLEQLNGFRRESAKGEEIKVRMSEIIEKMKEDQSKYGRLPVVKKLKGNVEYWKKFIGFIADKEIPSPEIEVFYRPMRSVYSQYETRLNKEKRIDRKRVKGISGRDIDMSFWQPNGSVGEGAAVVQPPRVPAGSGAEGAE